MKYKCINKLNQFDFYQASIASIHFNGSTFTMDLDNVTIKADNEHNRDIHDMRANNVLMTFPNTSIVKIIEEGYKVYDANDVLTENIEDQIVPTENYKSFFTDMEGNFIYSLETENDSGCSISIDSEYQTYVIQLSNNESCIEWNRFLKKD